ncbi:MAG TPA: hypothetical protein VFC44_22635 [Candidatus Saccharimonadales bacterium]|nr:hypothetical protein [Candidatus Saccharimonadales bacterium]
MIEVAVIGAFSPEFVGELNLFEGVQLFLGTKKAGGEKKGQQKQTAFHGLKEVAGLSRKVKPTLPTLAACCAGSAFHFFGLGVSDKDFGAGGLKNGH